MAEGSVLFEGTVADAIAHLQKVSEMINDYSADWNKDDLKSVIFPYADQVGRGDVLWPLRFALSGRDKSPDPIDRANPPPAHCPPVDAIDPRSASPANSLALTVRLVPEQCARHWVEPSQSYATPLGCAPNSVGEWRGP